MNDGRETGEGRREKGDWETAGRPAMTGNSEK